MLVTPNLKPQNCATWEVTYKNVLVFTSLEAWNGMKYMMLMDNSSTARRLWVRLSGVSSRSNGF